MQVQAYRQIEEIRNKLLEFKQTGKPIIAYSEVYNQAAYYLSSVANKDLFDARRNSRNKRIISKYYVLQRFTRIN